MKYIFYHRPIGRHDIPPETTEIEAGSKVAAESIFYDECQDLPIMVVKIDCICPSCNGTGVDPLSDNVDWLPCSSCKGTGKK
jgi:hypothetical protein